MIDKIISLFYDSCPGVIRSLDAIENAIKADGNHFIYRFDCDKLIACAVINKNIVVMLCVHPDYRKRGIGSALFNECEDYARSLGCDHIQLFGFDDYITPGAPIYEGNWEFFVKRGYEHTWGDGEWEGDQYIGEWVNGERTGYGKYIYANGTVEEGQFDNGKFVG